MWQIMHWLDGIERVKACLMGWPASFFWIVGSEEALKPKWPNCDRRLSGWDRDIRVDHMARGAAARAIVAGMIVRARERKIGSSSRVFCRPRNTGSVRSSVPKPRSLSLLSACPVLLRDSDCQSPLSCAPPRSKTRTHCRAAKFPSARADRAREGLPWREFLPSSASERS